MKDEPIILDGIPIFVTTDIPKDGNFNRLYLADVDNIEMKVLAPNSQPNWWARFVERIRNWWDKKQQRRGHDYTCTTCKKGFSLGSVIVTCAVIHPPNITCVVCPHCNNYNQYDNGKKGWRII